MGVVAQILGGVAGIGSLVCWVMTLIKMYKFEPEDKRVVQLIIGIICGIWAFIWGWKNAERAEHKQIMLIWTACIAVSIVANILARL